MSTLTTKAQTRARMSAFAVAMSLLFVFLCPLTAHAAINELWVNLSNPTPNPVPAGSTATVSAEFWLSDNTGKITVGISLNASPDFGTVAIDATSSELTDCQTTATTATCDWDGESDESPQTLTVAITVAGDASPYSGAEVQATAESDTEGNLPYSSTWIQVAPPVGTTSLSGTVITKGGAAVSGACVYALSAPSFVFATVADKKGHWSMTGLPDDWVYAIGVIPPYTGAYGPCADDGPPPVSGPGELQPVFYPDIWIDLADPELTGGMGDPHVFAVAAGATVFSDSTSDLVSCLTSAPGSVVPRPPCIAPVAPTTPTTVFPAPPVTTAPPTTEPSVANSAESSTTVLDILPFTGPDTTGLVAVGSLLILIGVVVTASTKNRTE